MPETSNHAPSQGERIIWLDLLRCLAVLLVVWGHVFLVGINDPGTVGIWLPDVKGLLFGPTTIASNPHGQFGLFLTLQLGFNVGSVGVALFFLISGYVILRTLDRIKPLTFIIRRVLRIFPVLWTCIAVTAAITYLYCAYFNVIDPQDERGLITSGFAANGYFGGFPTTPVLWSLTAELMFYAIFSVMALVFGRVTLNILLGLSLSCCLFACLPVFKFSGLWYSSVAWYIGYFGELLTYVTFMLIGSVFYRLQGESRLQFLLYFIAISVSWLVAYWAFAIAGHRHLGVDLSGGFWALAIFIAAKQAALSGRWHLPFEWIAAISYPLYLVHIPLGWMALTIAARMGAGLHMASLIGLVVAVFLAWIVHLLVERPAHSIGRRLGRRASPTPAHAV